MSSFTNMSGIVIARLDDAGDLEGFVEQVAAFVAELSNHGPMEI